MEAFLRWLYSSYTDAIQMLYSFYTQKANRSSEIRKYFQGRFVFLLNDKKRTKIVSGSE